MIQDTLIPNAVFLIPLLDEISTLGGPIQTDDQRPALEDDLRLKAPDGLAVTLPGVHPIDVVVTLSVEQGAQQITLNPAHAVSAFHLAMIREALEADFVRSGHHVQIKRRTVDGIPMTAVGVDHSVGPFHHDSAAVLLAEEWLAVARRDKRRSGFKAIVDDARNQLAEQRRQNEAKAPPPEEALAST